MRDVLVTKQSQFPATGIPHHPNIQLFQRSNPMPIVQNKANLPGGAGGVGRGMLYKQSQFPPEQKEGQRLEGKGVMVDNTSDRPR
jgi:hypothetical protein